MRTDSIAHFQKHERGSAALAVAVILLFATSIAVLYLNRNLIFDQRAAANLIRATTAQETAEAGLEWAIAMLTSPDKIGSACTASSASGAEQFRHRYIQPNYTTSVKVEAVTTAFPGCRINGSFSSTHGGFIPDGTLTCDCPNPDTGGTAANLGSTIAPKFTVAFQGAPKNPADSNCLPNSNVNNSSCVKDDMAVRVTVTGCTATSGNCTPGTATSASGPDAVAVVTAIVKLKRALRAGPPAALTCGGMCNPSGNFKVINTDPSTNGITINAGSTITLGGSAGVITMPGVPAQNSQLANDGSLSSLASSDSTCSGSSMFKAYFGSTVDEYRNTPGVMTIDCNSTNTCRAAIDTAYSAGTQKFYFPSGFYYGNSGGGGSTVTLGSPQYPVTIVTPGVIDIRGNVTVYGLLFSNDATLDDLGSGDTKIRGALVACRDYTNTGNGSLIYDPDVINRTGDSSSVAVRIPGSWTDTCRLSSAASPVLSCNQ